VQHAPSSKAAATNSAGTHRIVLDVLVRPDSLRAKGDPQLGGVFRIMARSTSGGKADEEVGLTAGGAPPLALASAFCKAVKEQVHRRTLPSFSVKAKRQKVAGTALAIELTANLEDEEEREKSALDNWMHRQAAGSVLQLEDAAGLSARRKEEGCVLASAGRFHEAIARFNGAIELAPTQAVLHELQAQCYMEAGDTYAAIRAAERSVSCDPQWAHGHQTLGRAQMNLGEVELAISSFETAMLLDPEGMAEVRDQDLPNGIELKERTKRMVAKADAQFLSGPLAHNRSQLPPVGRSTSVRHALGNGVVFSALPPTVLMRPQGS